MESSPPIAEPVRISVLATASGIAVANVYLCQPLLSEIAQSFHVASGAAGLVATAAQVGYALGILLIVPLADQLAPRKLMRILLGATCIALLCAGLSPALHVLAFFSLVATTVTVIPQILIPLAVSMSAPSRAGRVVGAMQLGLILGILLSRTISGLAAQFSGTWRASYLLAAVATGALLFVLPRYVPAGRRGTANNTGGYAVLLGSLPALLFRWRELRLSAVLGACMFGAFSAFWATLAFHLAAPPFGFGTAQAGLFGLWGIVGALLAARSGRLVDKIGPSRVNILSLACGAVAFALLFAGGGSYVLVVVFCTNLLDFANQAGQIANQARILKLDPAARARLNTVYMVFTFGGGAVGAAIGSSAWSHAGWNGVCASGAALVGIGASVIFQHAVRSRRVPVNL